jgi:hypothetical protein
MAIPESQLKSWSHYESTACESSKQAYDSLVSRLQSIASYTIGNDYEIFQQGSYANTTNIYGESSDVDVVLCYNNLINSDIHKLSIDEINMYHQLYKNSNETLDEFKTKVLNKLYIAYPTTEIIIKSKCISINFTSRKIDLVVANKYYIWNKCKDPYDRDKIEGIIFYDKDKNSIINFPKSHKNNGELKNQSVNVYKQMIRIFKKARNKAIQDGFLQKGVAPSYFIECLLFNVPNYYYSSNYQETFEKIMDYLLYLLDENWLCQNGIVPIFGTDITSWSMGNAKTFTKAMKDLWENWE